MIDKCERRERMEQLTLRVGEAADERHAQHDGWQIREKAGNLVHRSSRESRFVYLRRQEKERYRHVVRVSVYVVQKRSEWCRTRSKNPKTSKQKRFRNY